VIAQYPSASYATPKAALAALVTDAVFACPARKKARDLAKYVPGVYLYQFTQVPSYAAALAIGAFHGGEIDFVMGTLRERTAGMATMDELALSDVMLGSWSRFAKSGDPNDTSAPWPKYDAATDTSIAFGTPISLVTGLKKEKCDFWDAL
jgi:para-nitrobenzyl esterase